MHHVDRTQVLRLGVLTYAIIIRTPTAKTDPCDPFIAPHPTSFRTHYNLYQILFPFLNFQLCHSVDICWLSSIVLFPRKNKAGLTHSSPRS